MRLSNLGFGAAQGGNLYHATTDEEFASAVDAAWNAGVRYFDTAPHYGLGLSERRLGAALRSRPRNEYVVSTKVGRLLVASPETADRLDDGFAVSATHRRVWDFSRDGIRRSLEASLHRTGLDRIDTVYLHDPDDHWQQAAHEGVPALVELRDEGVVGPPACTTRGCCRVTGRRPTPRTTTTGGSGADRTRDPDGGGVWDVRHHLAPGRGRLRANTPYGHLDRGRHTQRHPGDRDDPPGWRPSSGRTLVDATRSRV